MIDVIAGKVDKIFGSVSSLDDMGRVKKEILSIMNELVRDKRTVPIKYIGKNPTQTDNLYGSYLTWKKGESLPVPVKIAEKLLRHYDVYKRANAVSRALEEKEIVKDPEPREEVDRNQEARDAVSRMNDIKSIRLFVHDNFAGNNLPAALKDIGEARIRATTLIDTVGLP